MHLSELIATAKISPSPTAPRLETSEFRISPCCPCWNCQNGEERCVCFYTQFTVVSFTCRVYGNREPIRGRRMLTTHSIAKSRTVPVRLISMAMTGFYRTMIRPRTHRPLSMLKYDPVVKKKVLFLEATKGGRAR